MNNLQGKVIEFEGSRHDYKTLLRENKDMDIFVKFSAEWCGPCKKIQLKLHRLFDEYNNQKKLLVLVDIDKCNDVASAMRIKQLPTIQTYKNGMPDQVIVGVDGIEMLFKNNSKTF